VSPPSPQPPQRRPLRRVDETSAGGLVLDRRGPEARAALIGRLDRRGRLLWSLPKGHVEAGETEEQTAVREVQEETGIRGRIVRELPGTTYNVSGRPKVVRYWLMEVEHEGPFVPNDETDELRWVPAGEALRLLSYDRDRDVLRSV